MRNCFQAYQNVKCRNETKSICSTTAPLGISKKASGLSESEIPFILEWIFGMFTVKNSLGRTPCQANSGYITRGPPRPSEALSYRRRLLTKLILDRYQTLFRGHTRLLAWQLYQRGTWNSAALLCSFAQPCLWALHLETADTIWQWNLLHFEIPEGSTYATNKGQPNSWLELRYSYNDLFAELFQPLLQRLGFKAVKDSPTSISEMIVNLSEPLICGVEFPGIEYYSSWGKCNGMRYCW